MFEAIKLHIKRHKVVYSFGAGIVFAGITLAIMRGRGAGLPESTASRSETVFTRSLFLFSNNNKIVTVVQRMGRGRPGNLTYSPELDRSFSSQTLAAAHQGVSDKVMSMHVRGKGLPDINGNHFERFSLPN